MHQAYVRQMANARLGTHDTKTRLKCRAAVLSLETKGTGRSRGSTARSGVATRSPHPRSYAKDMPARCAAPHCARRCLPRLLAAIVVVEDIKVGARPAACSIAQQPGRRCDADLIPEKAAMRIPSVRPATCRTRRSCWRDLNIRDLFTFDKVVLPIASLDVIQNHLG